MPVAERTKPTKEYEKYLKKIQKEVINAYLSWYERLYLWFKGVKL